MSQFAHALRTSRARARLAGTLILAALAASALVWIERAGADEGAPSSSDAVSTSVSNVATGRADAVDSTGGQGECTSSSVFVDMPGMSETFSFGGTLSRPVLALFQAVWANGSDGHAQIRLAIDGVVQPLLGTGVIVHEDRAIIDRETNGFNFISAPLAPGSHTATIQWRAGRGTICIGPRTLIVFHK